MSKYNYDNYIKKIPASQMRLYRFKENLEKSIYFSTKEELLEYSKTHKTRFNNTTIDYLGDVAGRSDVILLSYENSNPLLCGVFLYSAVDEHGYVIYNPERSYYTGNNVWEYVNGNIRDMYDAFRDRGIIFKDDVYAKIDETKKLSLKNLTIK